MQDAAINSANSSLYGDGTGRGTGSTSVNNVGRYEYVKATNAVPGTGGSLTLQGTGAGNGLINTYTNADATATQGQRRFQGEARLLKQTYPVLGIVDSEVRHYSDCDLSCIA